VSINNIKEKLKSCEYDFLRNNVNLGSNIILLGYGGSHAYGTNNENSDIDIRGIATNIKRNILTGNDFEQVVDIDTDTTVYSFDKIIQLLCSCNPNTIEILGLKPEHYLYLNPIGEELIQNSSLFLSKRAIHSFGGYANSQLRRLENKSARLVSQSQREKHILKSIEHASFEFKQRYFEMPDDSIKLYIDKSPREDYDTEIFCDINLKHYPLRDHKSMMSDMQTIIRGYSKIGKRNEKAMAKDKLGKHMMHLIRLYLMAFDILEKGKIITYRDKEHDFLMSIRNGSYLDDNRQPTKEFYEIVDEYENRLDKLKFTTDLPEKPDMRKVMDFVEKVNERVITEDNNDKK
jgi:predicted nucleotidyltransferase